LINIYLICVILHLGGVLVNKKNLDDKQLPVEEVPKQAEANFRPNSQNALDDPYYGDDAKDDGFLASEPYDPTGNWDG
jgi:hypothetical protein